MITQANNVGALTTVHSLSATVVNQETPLGTILRNLAGVEVSIPPAALVVKTKALSESKGILVVNSAPAEQMAVDAQKLLKLALRDVEKLREAAKTPILDLGRRVDALAKDYSATLILERDRVQALLDGYAEEKEAERVKEEADRQAELDRIAEEARKKDEEAQAAAQAQADAEAAAQAAKDAVENAKSAKGKAAAQKKLDAANAEAEAQAEKLAQAAKDTQAAEDAIRNSAPVVAPKAAGSSAKKMRFHEVTDITALHAARPDLCVIEASTSKINIAVGSPGTVIPQIPGVRIWDAMKTRT